LYAVTGVQTCALPIWSVRPALTPERLVEIEGGHCLHRDDPQRWLQAVDDFARAALG